MINASEPLEYIPSGQITVKKHPESKKCKINKYDEQMQTSLLQNRPKVTNSIWTLHNNESQQAEELFCSGKIAVYSKGNQMTNTFTTSYCCDTDIQHAVWCSFQVDDKNRILKYEQDNLPKSANTTVDCICLFDAYTLRVFTEFGERYISSLQFKVLSVWPTKFGIMLEKSILPTVIHGTASSIHTENLSTSEETSVPIIFSSTHPLDDICPVIIKHGSLSHMSDPGHRVLFTSIEPSLAFIYDSRTGLHSIYKIRKTNSEECQFPHAGANNTSLNSNSMFSSSVYNVINTRIGGKSGMNKTLLNNPGTAASTFISKHTSYTTCSVNLSSSSQQLSRSHSPMATISRCQSPTNFIFSGPTALPAGYHVHHSMSHQTLLALSSGQGERSAFYHDKQSKVNSCDPQSIMEITLPELCLEYIWIENGGQIKDSHMEPASKIFITTDLIGQLFFCYLIESHFCLFLVRIEKSNYPDQIILGKVTSIIAKDAINLQKLKMIAVIELNGNITLYSGASFVGKLHIPMISSNVGRHNQVFSNLHKRELSPYPRRSSLVSPRRLSLLDVKFDEGVHLLSPVGASCTNLNMTDISHDTFSMSFKTAISNKLIVESGVSNYLKIALPIFVASPIVSMCLQTLQNILPRDLSMQLLIKWYVARNAPGPQDLTVVQEWSLFLIIFFTLIGYDVSQLHSTFISDFACGSELCSPTIVSKKPKTNSHGTEDDWSHLLVSDISKKAKVFLFDAIGLNKLRNSEVDEKASSVEHETCKTMKIQSSFIAYLPHIFFAMHLLYEEIKLCCNMSETLLLLAKLLHRLSIDLNMHAYKYHYVLDFPILKKDQSQFSITATDLCKTAIPSCIISVTPNIFKTIFDLLTFSSGPPYPYLFQVNPISKHILQILASLHINHCIGILELDQFFKTTSNSTHEDELPITKCEKKPAEEIVLFCYKKGMDKRQLENLPIGVNFLIRNIIYQCREKALPHLPSQIYELIDRQDLSALEKKSATCYPIDHLRKKMAKYVQSVEHMECHDGMEFDYTILQLRFNKDHRIREVRKLLNSSEPVKISVIQRPDVSDHEFIEEQERCLHALSTRTMALTIGRGMFTLRTAMPINTEQLSIPRLCLTGKALPRGTTVELTHIDVPPNMNLWPLFHNGVATGLCIHPNALNVDSTWIVYNKQQQSELGIEHSGFLMALGLNGHLKNLAPFSMYEYLVECHETTSVGLLLGLSATHRSSMNVSMTKLLSLHVETLLPPTSIELNVQQNVQVAALMGVGLVYQETNHRHIAHALLSEIGRPPGPEMKNSIDRESYSLAAGLALGLVVLSSGGGSDLANIPDTLHYYMVGGSSRPFAGAQKDKYKSPSYQIREGDSINVDITSPGATMAIGLMYHRTENHAVAEWMAAPNTQYLLDFVRPDLLLLRILAKSLILWDEIQPSKTWVSNHVPSIVAKYKLQKPTDDITDPVDLESINQAYCNIIAGACLAVGLKYAGTENDIAFKTLYHFLKMFMTLSQKSIAELAGKATIETCLNVVLLSASVVMSGTGNLELLRVCRYIRTRVGPTHSAVTYGSYLAIHMALGFLFLGGGSYTLSNNPSAVAALVISLFPKFPTHSNDNRYHLQAFRHFYVLAAEPRLLLPKDIDSGRFCYSTIKLTFQSDACRKGQKVFLKAPCVLPQLTGLRKIELEDDRYWKITFDTDRNFDQLERILNSDGVLNVKQRAGCISHVEDPQGFRTLLAQTLTTEDIIVWKTSLKQITSFTADTTVLSFVNGFLGKEDSSDQKESCDCYKHRVSEKFCSLCFIYFESSDRKVLIHFNQVHDISQKISPSEKDHLQNFITMTYECVVRDKISFLPLWISIYQLLKTFQKQPWSYLVWQIKFVHSPMIFKTYFQGLENLLSMENIAASKQLVSSTMDAWEKDIAPIVHDFSRERFTKPYRTGAFDRFISYVLYYDTPLELSQFAKTHSENFSIIKTIPCFKVEGHYKLQNLQNMH